ncbi:sugar ABC transporter substrate-binding protein [Bacillus horti]|uniref:D-xylose transport system substrate-binding protein n=1 Tax=Caldalkalibacillus horti TaxID=77523 RepID=A0ABT9W2K3_9BACI|nr:substrate-binding domain-containing protein [Bacillus horti]MDQ0167474.1 D-xylose transport system substrate-binding protein [Bacillus horti]
MSHKGKWGLIVFVALCTLLIGCIKNSNEESLDENVSTNAMYLGKDSAVDVAPSNSEESLSPGSASDDSKKIRIGFSMDTLEEERWLKDRDLFKKAVEQLGAEVEILAANGDEALQVVQAETLINRGVDVLVIVPYNAESAATIVTKAQLAGIKVISYDRLIKNADIDLYVSFDNERVGELQAEAMIRLVPEGKYVYIGGAETDYNAHLLKKGVFNVLQPLIDQGDIHIVYDQWTTNWLPSNAFLNMQEALKANNNQIDAVIAANDATAGMALKALEEAGLAGQIPVAGQDAELAAVQRIVQGIQTMTVYKPIGSLAEEVASLSVSLAKGEVLDIERKLNNGKVMVPSVLLSPVSVNRSNLDETILADGFHSEEDIYSGGR